MVNVIESRAVHRGFEHSIVAFGRKCILHKRKIPQRSTQVVWRQYEEFEDTKGTIRIRTSKMATRKRTKGEKWSIKYYTETYRLSYTNPTKSPGVYSGVPDGLTVPVPLVTPCRVILYTNPVISPYMYLRIWGNVHVFAYLGVSICLFLRFFSIGFRNYSDPVIFFVKTFCLSICSS
jgi:hypothetical protein